MIGEVLCVMIFKINISAFSYESCGCCLHLKADSIFSAYNRRAVYNRRNKVVGVKIRQYHSC